MAQGKKLFLVLGFLFFAGFNLYAEEPSITIEASVNKSEIALGEYCNYRAVISSSVNLVNPGVKLPDLEKDFIVLSSSRGQNVLFSGGRTKIQIILNYVLGPKMEGEFEIGPLELAYRGKTYKSKSVKVKVAPAKGAAPELPEEEEKEEPLPEKITL